MILTEATRSREQRYLAAIERALRLRDRAIETQVRAVLGHIATLRRGMVDGMLDLPTVRGRLRADGLAVGRSLIDREIAAFQDRLQTTILPAGRTIATAGSNLTPMALVSAGVAPARSTTLLEAVDPIPDFEDARFLSIDPFVLTRIEANLASQVVAISESARQNLRLILTRGLAGQSSMDTMLSQVRTFLATQPLRTTGHLGPLANQADNIVRTELLGAFATANQARSEEMASIVPGLKKYWLATRDNRTRQDHIAAGNRYAPGARPGPIGARAEFIVGGEKCQYPHDSRLSAKQRARCRCVKIDYKAEWFGEETSPPTTRRPRATPPTPSPPRPEIPARFENLAAAERWASQRYSHITWDFAGAHIETIDPTLREFHRLAGLYPEATNGLRYVGTYQTAAKSPSRVFPFDTATAHAWRGDLSNGMHIALNPDYYGNPAKLLNALTRSESSGWSPPGTGKTYASIFTHEFGHIVDYWLTSQSSVSVTRAVTSGGQGLLSDTFFSWQGEHGLRQWKAISQYATTNRAEAWAESFSALTHTPRAKWSTYTKAQAKFLDGVRELPLYGKDEWRWFSDLEGDERDQAREEIRRILHQLGIGQTI